MVLVVEVVMAVQVLVREPKIKDIMAVAPVLLEIGTLLRSMVVRVEGQERQLVVIRLVVVKAVILLVHLPIMVVVVLIQVTRLMDLYQLQAQYIHLLKMVVVEKDKHI